MNSIFSVMGILLNFNICNTYAQESPYHLIENTAIFTLEVHGLNKIEGELRIAMFDSKESFIKEPVLKEIMKVDSSTIYWKVENLSHGNYAIAVYHDKNGNGKLDTSLFGIPKERYGFSNNARGAFGPASWDESYFTFDVQNKTHAITIR
jgi:uncharacterized protein (DUF2141 family)